MEMQFTTNGRHTVAQILHHVLGTAGLCCSQVLMEGVKFNPEKTVSITYFPGVTSEDKIYLQASGLNATVLQRQRQALWAILHTAGLYEGKVIFNSVEPRTYVRDSGRRLDKFLRLSFYPDVNNNSDIWEAEYQLVEVGPETGDPLASPYQYVTGTYQLRAV